MVINLQVGEIGRRGRLSAPRARGGAVDNNNHKLNA